MRFEDHMGNKLTFTFVVADDDEKVLNTCFKTGNALLGIQKTVQLSETLGARVRTQ